MKLDINAFKIFISTVFIFSLALIMHCCKSQYETDETGEVIRVDPNTALEEINLSEFVDTIFYIKLQTEENDFLGRVRDVQIKNKYIYARDISQHSVYVFDKQGNYISKLHRHGKGPGEYPRISPIVVDDNEEFIEMIPLWDGQFRKYSNITFDLIEQYSTLDINFSNVRKDGNIYYIATKQNDNLYNEQKTNAGLFIVRNGKIETVLFDKTIHTGGSYFGANSESFTRNDLNELFISIMYDNTFYQLKDMNAYPIITIDFGRDGIDNSIGLKSLEEQLEYLKSSYRLASFPVLNINNTDIMAFSYYFQGKDSNTLPGRKEDLHQYIQLKNSGQAFHTKKIKNDITNFPEEVVICTYHPLAHEAWYKNYLVDIVDPGIYFSGKEENSIMVEGIGEVNINNNPIIVFMKLKKSM